jgi:hypothetical protein
LQQRLGQTVHPHGQPDARRIVAPGQPGRFQREDRQHQKQPEHAQRKNARQRKAGAALIRQHAVGVG